MFGCCSPTPKTIWAAPHEGDFSEDLLIDNYTDTDTGTESSGVDYRIIDSGIDSDLCPTWMADKDSNECLQCDKPFTTSNRRSHWYVMYFLSSACEHICV